MTMKILFVEDHLELLDDLVAIIVYKHPEWHLEFAADILSAREALQVGTFDAVVIDVMLPAFKSIPPREEGIHLAGWILNKTKIPPLGNPPLRGQPKIIFYTSRAVAGVRADALRLGLASSEYVVIPRTKWLADEVAKGLFIIIGRTDGLPDEHYKKIVDFIG
jgi:CheY-like chemotaxis protein